MGGSGATTEAAHFGKCDEFGALASGNKRRRTAGLRTRVHAEVCVPRDIGGFTNSLSEGCMDFAAGREDSSTRLRVSFPR